METANGQTGFTVRLIFGLLLDLERAEIFCPFLIRLHIGHFE
jgi:hypothetical protein